ncbi:WD repeat-containing protein 90 isoform X3 [Nycticebus coucang]|uniref:WD repeat-containing protein 90 isoform X3 n=1 Tax=Nycticebus coucang TaxID=9470 RepID=UPI00234CA3D7|nr:WD repeat-containing protein 90 isoform X3 [Nycticebus coucang]
MAQGSSARGSGVLGIQGSGRVGVGRAWQQPFLNVFRHFRVDEWKRSAKEGDVAVVTDKTLKGTVYRIRGAVSASSYIQLPRTSTQSLGLTGRYLYVLFRPLRSKHFVIHLDVSTEDSQVIRVSFSSLFKEFKSTATWLQFPFVFEARTSRRDLAGVAPAGTRWTFLQLNLQDILLLYLNHSYSHLKSVRLCASLLVRNLYTSDLCFDPAASVTGARQAKLPIIPVPREMAFPVPKGENWHDHYAHVRFPSNGVKVPSELVQKTCPPGTGLLGSVSQPLPCLVAISKPVQNSGSPTVQKPSPTASSECSGLGVLSVRSQPPAACSEDTSVDVAAHSVHVSAHESAVALEDSSCQEHLGRQQRWQEVASGKSLSQQRHFLPDPILRLKKVIGFGGHSTKWALWTKDGAAVIYPCHAVIITLCIDTGEQRFFLGHTDKVSALALDGSNSLLASACTRPPCMLRLWDFQTGVCLSLFRSPIHIVSALSFSNCGSLLCGVGKDRHGRTVVVAWGTGPVRVGGEVVILAKVHTDFDVQAFRVAFFDGTRMASCGQGSVRLWRLHGGVLRSCPVDLKEHRALPFTDLAFEQAQDSCQETSSWTLYVCSRSGHILEIDHQRMAVQHARCLLPMRTPSSPHPQKQTFGAGPGIAISSLSISSAMCAVGSEDGRLRLWPLDFSSVLLEAEHEGPISSVCISPDGLRVLSTTSMGHLGFLDIPSREYSMLARSHTASVLAFSMDQSRGQLATVSQDHTVRIWDLATLQQLYDFTSLDDAPHAITFHPIRPAFFCGFSSGAVRSFSLEATDVMVEHMYPQGAITGLAVTPDGTYLFSSCSRGNLAQYNCSGPRCCILRVAASMVCPDAHPSPNILAVSGDSHLLAFVGPSKGTVTIVDSASLDELLQVNISTLDQASSCLDSAVAIYFSPVVMGHLLVSTTSKIMVLDATSGHTIRELYSVHPEACPSLALSEDAHFLLMATGRAVTLWDYSTQASPGSQVYIGHSEPVQAVAFTPDRQHVLSVGDAIFLWDILATPERQVSICTVSAQAFIWALLMVSPCPSSDQRLSRATPAHGAGPGIGQLDDAVSGASGLPRLQVPMPSQASPLRLIHARPLEGGDGALSASDEDIPCEKSHSPEGLCQAPGPLVLEEKESGARDGAWGAAGASWGFAVLPCLCSWPSAESTRNRGAQPCTHLYSYKHFFARHRTPAKSIAFSPASGQQLRLKAVLGYSGSGRANMVWRPDTGFFAYTCGCLVVVEDLHSGTQQHWFGHPEEISTLALSHNTQVLASASGRSSMATHCQIRIWDISEGVCHHLISHHNTNVQALAFSSDDRLLVTLGDYGDRTLALWNTTTYDLVSSTHLPEPVHGVAFNPWEADELVCVGQHAVTFWLLQQHRADINLQVRRESVPEAVGADELTSLCYGPLPLLYCGSSSGQVCVWDTRAGHCFLAWEADDSKIGVLLCSGSRLVSGSSAGRLRLWAVGTLPELRHRGTRSCSVFMECELSLDGAIVSASFDDSMDMGVVGTTAGTLWYVSWVEGTSTRLVSGHRSKPRCGSPQVNEVAFSPSESHCATCGEDGSVRVWSLASLELVIQFQVLNQSCLCLAWSPPSCGRPEQQRLAAGYSDGTLRLFSVSRTVMELKMHPHLTALTAVAFSTDGQTILSGDKDGLVAVSRPCTGMTFRVVSDHQGAPISTIQITSKEHRDFGVEGTDLWLAASGDQRVSVWGSNWLRNHCELLDWLSFPMPAGLETQGHLPPSLAAFCPWDRGLLVYVGPGGHKEVIVYSLHQKQVVERIPVPFFATSLSLSTGACLMAIGFAERVLRLVDCTLGTSQDFTGHGYAVHLCRFTPSARQLFTVAHNEILVWEVTGH